MLPTHIMVLVCSATETMDWQASLYSSYSTARHSEEEREERELRKSWYKNLIIIK